MDQLNKTHLNQILLMDQDMTPFKFQKIQQRYSNY